MADHFFNTCPICGDVSKCRCSHCKRAHTFNVCARCSEETTADYTDTAPMPVSDRDPARREHRPNPHDPTYPYLPLLMHKLGFNYLASAVFKKMQSSGGASWNTFFDPLTKRHIIKTGRLPGKEESSTDDEASLDHIRGEQDEEDEDEMIREYLKKVGKAYKDRKKNFKL